jgi:hypothetical protein
VGGQRRVTVGEEGWNGCCDCEEGCCDPSFSDGLFSGFLRFVGFGSLVHHGFVFDGLGCGLGFDVLGVLQGAGNGVSFVAVRSGASGGIGRSLQPVDAVVRVVRSFVVDRPPV